MGGGKFVYILVVGARGVGDFQGAQLCGDDQLSPRRSGAGKASNTRSGWFEL